MNQEMKDYMSYACQEAEAFSKNYYKLLDTCRSEITRLYDRDAVLVYNGNSCNPSYLANLPKSHHTVNTLNAQPVGTQEMILQISGVVEFTENNPKVENLFNQTLFLKYVAQIAKWKIVSDTIRIIEKHPVTESAEKKIIVTQVVPVEKIEILDESDVCFNINNISSGFEFPTFSTNHSQESIKSQNSDTKFEEALNDSVETTQKMEHLIPGTLQSMIEVYPNNMDIKTEDNLDE